MARMPQIPQIDYGERGGRVENAPLISPELVARPFEEGASALEGLAKTQQQALAQKQEMYDERMATRAVGDFDSKLATLAQTYKDQNLDTPTKAADGFTVEARRLADDSRNALPNSDQAQHFSRGSEEAINRHTLSMQGWAQLRMTQQAKSSLSQDLSTAVDGATSTLNPDRYIQGKLKDFDKSIRNLTSDPEKVKRDFGSDATMNWALSTAEKEPARVLAAVDDPKSVLHKYLDEAGVMRVERLAKQSMKGVGKEADTQGLKDGLDLLHNAFDLFRTNELSSRVSSTLQRSLDQKRVAVAHNPNFDDESRDAQLKAISLQKETIDALDSAARNGSAHNSKDDEKVQAKLVKTVDMILKPGVGKTGADFGAVMRARRDMAVAYSDGKISWDTFSTLDHTVGQAFPRNLGKAVGTGAPSGLHPVTAPYQAPHAAATSALDSYFDPKNGMFGNFTPEQQGAARVLYLKQMNDAVRHGQNVDEKAARVMARRAVYSVARGGGE